ncbi:uncharacterized protein [Haliotis asinina]|uniref:uncharacterized protein n=1 Tax=Haliotis asinina TaxID=109174 RepID=UPI003531B3DC
MYDDIDALADKVDIMQTKLSDFDEEIDRLEAFSRRDNVIIYGVPECSDEDHVTCKQKAVNLMNEFVKTKKWQKSDLSRAHRLGSKRTGSDRPRPLIAKFKDTDDKIEALKARTALQNAGYGISSDLTARQRQQLKELEGTGLRGYFKHGKLVTEPDTRRTTRKQPSESTTTRRTLTARRPSSRTTPERIALP